MARKKWNYTGDMNLEHGGLYYRKNAPDDDYYDAVRVTPVGSSVGGPDCIYMIESGTLYTPVEKYNDALAIIGAKFECPHAGGARIRIKGYNGPDEIIHAHTTAFARIIAEAFEGYAGVEDPTREIVQIGKLTQYDPDPLDAFLPDRILRANYKLENYVKKEWL